jgi:hypothetical protein
MLEAATSARVGRRKEFDEQLRLPLAAGTIARIDAVLAPEEARLDMIREAIEREIKRRKRVESKQYWSQED